MELSLTASFLYTHKVDFDYFKSLCHKFDFEQFWKEIPSGNSMANILCHIVEMEAFWMDWGFDDKPFDRNRQIAFDRKRDLEPAQMVDLLELRFAKTQKIVASCSAEALKKRKIFHGDDMDKESMLNWHIHHLGLHLGQLQMLEKFFTL